MFVSWVSRSGLSPSTNAKKRGDDTPNCNLDRTEKGTQTPWDGYPTLACLATPTLQLGLMRMIVPPPAFLFPWKGGWALDWAYLALCHGLRGYGLLSLTACVVPPPVTGPLVGVEVGHGTWTHGCFCDCISVCTFLFQLRLGHPRLNLGFAPH